MKKFNAILIGAGKTATGIEVPADVVASLNAGKKPAVKVTINNFSYRSTIASMGGKFMLPVSAERRESAGIAAGDKLVVQIELDNTPREAVVPADLEKLLDKNSKAKKVFESLSYSNKLRHILSIQQAKTPETRQRRLEKAISALEESSR